MRKLPEGLQAHLDGGATTLCWCWKLVDAQGRAQGFTDHDVDLEFGGLRFEAASGFAATEIESSLGFAVDNLDVEGALSSKRLREDDLRAGRYDNAVVEIWLVNWRDPDQRLLLRKGNIGEITRGRNAFTAEIRGLAHHLQQPQGRIYQYGCDAALGDARCKLDLSSPLYRAEATVAAAESAQRFAVSGLDAYAEGWFARGRIEWRTGANEGRAMELRRHRREGASTMLELWQSMALPVAPGDSFLITAGCDKQFATCRDKFSNALNFRGFPHMPGNDFVLSYASRD
jgi:uncharacterized phage protein (TIGR02218 family)